MEKEQETVRIRDEKGRFVSGYIFPLETKVKLSETRKRLFKEGKLILTMKDKKHTKEARRKISESIKGENHPMYGKKNNWGHHSEKTREKLSESHKGEKNPNWIDGRSKLFGPARYGDDWEKIRYLIYLRDRFTCQSCGITGERLDVHHKIPFLFSLDNSLGNLITLCKPCHRKEETRIMKELKNKQELILN